MHNHSTTILILDLMPSSNGILTMLIKKLSKLKFFKIVILCYSKYGKRLKFDILKGTFGKHL